MLLVAQVLRRGLPACALLVCAGLPASAGASAWMRSEGELQLSMSLSLSTAEERWDKDRRLISADCTTHRQGVDVHGEYGYSYYYTVFADAGVSNKECSGEQRVSGLSDLTVGVRGRIDPFRNGRSWEVSLKLPVSGDTNDPARPGNGEFGLNLGVHFRLSPDPYVNPVLVSRDAIWSWGAGLRLWTGGLAHQGWAYVGWGRDIGDSLWNVSARLDGVRSFGESGTSGRSFRSNDYDKLTATLGLRRQLTRDASVSIDLAHDLWGRKSGRQNTLRLGVSRQWR